MAINLGGAAADDIKLGSGDVELYLGNDQVWPVGPIDQPVISSAVHSTIASRSAWTLGFDLRGLDAGVHTRFRFAAQASSSADFSSGNSNINTGTSHAVSGGVPGQAGRTAIAFAPSSDRYFRVRVEYGAGNTFTAQGPWSAIFDRQA